MSKLAFCIFSAIMLSGTNLLNRFIDRGLENTQRKVIALMDEVQAHHLVTNYADMILRISYNYLNHTYDAEDICQTVFLKYLTSAPEFSCDEQEKAWIIRTTVNACKDHLKSFWRKNTVELDETIAFTSETGRELWAVVNSLSPKYRIVIHLYYYEGYSQDEIAEILKISRTAVQTRMSRAREQLKEVLKEYE